MYLQLHRLYAQLSDLVEKRLWLRVLLGLVFGILTGFVLGPSTGLIAPSVARVITNWVALPGDLFIRLVQMIMIPLVVASIIQGIAGGGERDRLARLGPRVLIYFLATTVVAIGGGLGVSLFISPGRGSDLARTVASDAAQTSTKSGLDVPSIIAGLLPTNPLASALAGEMLSIVIFAIIIGAALVSMPKERAEPTLDLLFSVQEICMTVTKWAMRLAPFAVFGLMARTIANSGLSVVASLGLYVLTVICALLIVMLMYVAIIALMTKQGLRHFFRSSSDVMLLAFSVASSAAVMPLTMKTAEEKLHVPEEVTRFVVPIGAIMNMNGTAAYQAVATVFLAQVYGLELSLPALGLVVVTTVAASVGTPSAPGAGIIILATVLASAGIPVEGISLILGVDHLLGMSRTAVNVTGDLAACAVFADTATASAESSAVSTDKPSPITTLDTVAENHAVLD